MMDRAARLAHIAQGLREIRWTLGELTGPRCAELRMLDDLALAVETMRQQAQRPRSAPSTVRRWTTTSNPQEG